LIIGGKKRVRILMASPNATGRISSPCLGMRAGWAGWTAPVAARRACQRAILMLALAPCAAGFAGGCDITGSRGGWDGVKMLAGGGWCGRRAGWARGENMNARDAAGAGTSAAVPVRLSLSIYPSLSLSLSLSLALSLSLSACSMHSSAYVYVPP
jgi:hypothetical protein